MGNLMGGVFFGTPIMRGMKGILSRVRNMGWVNITIKVESTISAVGVTIRNRAKGYTSMIIIKDTRVSSRIT